MEIKCFRHAEADAAGCCCSCGKYVCSSCRLMLKSKYYCVNCAKLYTYERWWLWLIASIVILVVSLFLAYLGAWIAIFLAYAAAPLAAIGLSKRLAGEIPWWGFVLVIVMSSLMSAQQSTGTMNNVKNLLSDYISLTALATLIGTLIINSQRKKLNTK